MVRLQDIMVSVENDPNFGHHLHIATTMIWTTSGCLECATYSKKSLQGQNILSHLTTKDETREIPLSTFCIPITIDEASQ
eukprot:scaffold8239_cov54-Attheya_sp.AAC.2